MKHSTIKVSKYKIGSVVGILAIWSYLSTQYSSIIVPSISEVIKALSHIVTSGLLWEEVSRSGLRLIIGLTITIVLGSILGILSGISYKVYHMLEPIIGIMQSIPVISWLVLALLWFGLDGQASIFIVVISTLPIIIINLVESIKNIDGKLLEMAEIFGFSKIKVLRTIVIPSIIPYFQSALQLVIGMGWKVVVMGEVLSSCSGIGGQLTKARVNIETEYVFAWSIIIVLLFQITNGIMNYLFERKIKGDRYDFINTKPI